MHGERCKCMECARARHEARKEAAWREHPQEMAKATVAVARAQEALTSAQEAVSAARAMQQRVLDKVA